MATAEPAVKVDLAIVPKRQVNFEGVLSPKSYSNSMASPDSCHSSLEEDFSALAFSLELDPEKRCLQQECKALIQVSSVD